MNIYVMADENYGISCKGKPLASIPAEKKSKLSEIAGSVVVYGEKYISELPGQQPLLGCKNIIFTDGVKTRVKTGENVLVFDTIEEVLKELQKYPSDRVNVIDNEKLYKACLPFTEVIHMTKIEYTYSADAFFENMDTNKDFTLVADSEEQYCFDIVYYFLKYERKKERG